ncbi:MAG: hypothetical protein K0S07_383 [Chlamydiales bacterium]|jgi:outer membrane protein TolC|nr:hypothetical protein [Chlamydiales bacterium]
MKKALPLILLTCLAACRRDAPEKLAPSPLKHSSQEIREEAILKQEAPPVQNPTPDPIKDLEEEEPISIESGRYTFTLEGAINRALTSNRKLVGSLDQVSKAKLNLDYSGSEFELKILPRSGFELKPHTTTVTTTPLPPALPTTTEVTTTQGFYRAGFEFRKQLSFGTKLAIEPSLSRHPDRYSSNVRFSLTQPLFRGFSREYNLSPIKTAEFNFRSACRSFYMAEVSLIVNVVSTLYDLVKNQQTVLLNEESYHRLKTYLESALIKERIGLSDSLDVYRAEMELKQAEEQLLSSKSQLLDVQDRFKDLLALPLDAEVALDASLEFRETEFNFEEVVETALKKRIEIDQAADRLSENMRLSKRAEEGMLPDLNLNFSYKTHSQAERIKKLGRDWNDGRWELGLSTGGDLERSKEKLAYTQSMLAIQTAQRDLDQTKETVVLETRRTLRQLLLAKDKKAKVQEVIKNAEGKLYLSQLKFERGMANNFDVLQAEKELRQANIRLLSSVIDQIINEYKLYAAMGILADKPEI